MLKLHMGHNAADPRSRVHGYLRTSTPSPGHAEQWTSRISAFCAARGLALDELYLDLRVTGDAVERPAFSALVGAVAARPPVGVVVAIAHLSPDPGTAALLAAQLRTAGAPVIVVETFVAPWSTALPRSPLARTAA